MRCSIQWSLLSVPPASAAVLSDPTAAQPTFLVDAAGEYVVQLIVHDATVNSAPDTLMVTTANSRPVADAGADRTVFTGDTVTLTAAAPATPTGTC